MDRQTALTQSRYDRIAPFYDAMEGLVERYVFGALRSEFWSHISGANLLEVGVGTGKNIPYYPKDSRVTAVDLSEQMLDRARRKASSLGNKVDLCQMDIQKMDFPDASFDTAAATFVFCSVPEPLKGLRELGRVVRPGGDIWLLEHVRINRPAVTGSLMDLLNPFVVRMMGTNINRRTVDTVRQSGLQVVDATPVRGNMVRLIHARPV